MDSFTVICKNITPLIMSGVNQKKAEFRSASVKGMMRWWFRIAGGSREDENWLFGSTNAEFDKKKSTKQISLRSGFIIQTSIIEKKECNPRELLFKKFIPQYFGFSMRWREKGFTRSTFKIKIHFSNRLNNVDREKILSSLWLALYLGNFGFRSRKGFGAIIVKHIDSAIPWWLDSRIYEDTSQFGHYIAKNINIIRNISNASYIKSVHICNSPFHNLEKYYKEFRARGITEILNKLNVKRPKDKLILKKMKFMIGDAGQLCKNFGIDRFASPIIVKPTGIPNRTLITYVDTPLLLISQNKNVIKNIEKQIENKNAAKKIVSGLYELFFDPNWCKHIKINLEKIWP